MHACNRYITINLTSIDNRLMGGHKERGETSISGRARKLLFQKWKHYYCFHVASVTRYWIRNGATSNFNVSRWVQRFKLRRYNAEFDKKSYMNSFKSKKVRKGKPQLLPLRYESGIVCVAGAIKQAKKIIEIPKNTYGVWTKNVTR